MRDVSETTVLKRSVVLRQFKSFCLYYFGRNCYSQSSEKKKKKKIINTSCAYTEMPRILLFRCMFLTFLTNNYLKAIAICKVDITKFRSTACALNVRNFYLWEVGGGGEGVGVAGAFPLMLIKGLISQHYLLLISTRTTQEQKVYKYLQ